jgi:hypothetical protein
MKFLYSNSYISKAYKKLRFFQLRSFFFKSNADSKYINKNFTNSKIAIIRSQDSLSSFLNEIINGIILGDGHLSKSSLTSNC